MWAWVALLVGGVFGAASGSDGVWLLGGLTGWLLVRLAQAQRRIGALERRLDETGPVASQAQPEVAAQATPATVAPDRSPAETSHATALPAHADTAAAVLPPGTAVPEEAAVPLAHSAAPMAAPMAAALEPEARAPGPLDDALATVRGWLFGGNTIVKAGVAILFIGLAFLARYASEHVQVPPELRLAGVGAVALVLLVLGWRLRHLRAGYAQVLQGGAVAVLYLTVFVAWRWYTVLGPGPAFAFMVVVAAAAAALAVLQNAPSLAVIGALGGFMVPLLVSTGSGNVIVLLSYYLVLDLGIAVVAWWRTWRVLNAVGFVFTFGVAGAWGAQRYTPEAYVSSQLFLLAFFVVFLAVLLMPARRLPDGDVVPMERVGRWVNGSLLFGLPTVVFGLQMGLMAPAQWPYGRALSALALGAVYVGLAAWARRRAALSLVFEGALGIAAVLLTLTIPLALDARSTAAAWALEGAGLVWLGLRQQRVLPRALGYLLIVIGGFALLHGHERAGAPQSWLNATLLSGLLGTIGALLAARAVQRAEKRLPGEAVAEPLLIGWGSLTLAAVLLVQVDGLVPNRLQLSAFQAALALALTAYAVAAARLAWPNLGRVAIGHAPWLLLVVGAGTVWRPAPWADGGAWAWPLALLAHAAILRLVTSDWSPRVASATHALGVWVLAALGALAGRAITRDWGDSDSAWRWLGLLAAPAVLLLALPRPGLLARWPLRAQPAAYHPLASGVLVVALLLWMLLANAASNGSARPLPHLPLLNPLDLGIALALFAAWSWVRGAQAQRLLSVPPSTAWAGLGLLGFAWLNGMLIRAFHHWADVPYRLSAWSNSLAVQTGLTLLWASTALALMWWAARRAQRLPWMAGAALLGVVVLKLVLVDLSGSGTVTRIVSFIGVGVLMLVIGWVAPLPARAAASAADDAVNAPPMAGLDAPEPHEAPR
ncbi:MAG: DUF2339 domain-containing protein [Aquabacterium sp.]